MMGMQSHVFAIVSFICELMPSKNKHFALCFLQKRCSHTHTHIHPPTHPPPPTTTTHTHTHTHKQTFHLDDPSKKMRIMRLRCCNRKKLERQIFRINFGTFLSSSWKHGKSFLFESVLLRSFHYNHTILSKIQKRHLKGTRVLNTKQYGSISWFKRFFVFKIPIRITKT